MKEPIWKRIFLKPDGGGGDGADGGDEGAAGVMDQDAADQQGRGAEESAQGQEASPPVPDKKARKAAFEKLIREEYPEEFQEKSQRMIQNRLRGAKAAEEQAAKLAPALKLLQQQYGTDDMDALVVAITNDDRYYEQEAQKRGMDTETYKLIAQQDERLQAYREREEAQREKQQRVQQVMQWRAQEKELQGMYPQFDLNSEMEENPEFFQLLKNGVSVKSAYQAIHMDEIMGNTVAGAMQRAAQRTVDTIRANGLRPQENGAGKAPGRQTRVDVSKLTDKQMRELERRAWREDITPDKLG